MALVNQFEFHFIITCQFLGPVPSLAFRWFAQHSITKIIEIAKIITVRLFNIHLRRICSQKINSYFNWDFWGEGKKKHFRCFYLSEKEDNVGQAEKPFFTHFFFFLNIFFSFLIPKQQLRQSKELKYLVINSISRTGQIKQNQAAQKINTVYMAYWKISAVDE